METKPKEDGIGYFSREVKISELITIYLSYLCTRAHACYCYIFGVKFEFDYNNIIYYVTLNLFIVMKFIM
jgi:hypothetical protein